MKWNEIPKFKEFGTLNPESIGFVGYVKRIQKEVDDYNLQLNPDFQRGHVWNEKQQIAYIEFFLKGGKSGRDFYFNLNSKEYVCVDGLQRTIALTRFVNNEIKAFGQYFDEFEFDKFLVEYQTRDEFSVNIYRNNLNSKKEVLEWYIDMNSGGTPHTEEEIERVKQMILELED